MHNSEEAVTAIYRPLDKADPEIRLVFLEPAPERSMPLICRLQTVGLGDKPVYEALSWAWGDVDVHDEILLEGRSWFVRTNLVSALRHLRYEGRTRVMWIDALSINQDGSVDALREREHQIQLMKYIYSMACHVVVWMGLPGDEMAGFVQKFLAGERSLWTGFEEEHTLRQTVFYSLDIRHFPWWRRLWILQEVSVASDTFVQLGNAWIKFDRLLSELAMVHQFLWRYFERHGDEKFRITALAFAGSYVPSPHTFYDLREQSHCQAIQYRTHTRNEEKAQENSALSQAMKAEAFEKFAKCVVRFRYHEASNPLDKLYALLGLVPDLVGSGLNPRYDENVAAMYQRTAIHIIQSSKSLYILSQAQLPMLIETPYAPMLPSWVPDWTAKAAINRGWLCSPLRETREELFDASSGALCEVLTRDDNRILGLRGVLIDTISSTPADKLPWAEKFQQWWDNTREWREIAGVYEFQSTSQTPNRKNPDIPQERLNSSSVITSEVNANNKDYYIDGSKLNRAYWRTLLHNTAPYRDELDLKATTFSRIYERSETPLLATAERKHLSLCSEEFLQTCLNFSEEHYSGHTNSEKTLDLEELFTHLERVNEHRTFFVSNDGFIGTGTTNIRSGDQVWVLAGATHPLILREVKDDLSLPQGRCYVLVGEAYVEGVMMSGDINKPYASHRVRERLRTGCEYLRVDDDAGIWDELWLQ